MIKPTSTIELLATMFLFSSVVTSGLFYTLGTRYRLSMPWIFIPGIALTLTGLMYWRVRVRRGAAQADRQQPQNPSTTPPPQDQ